MIAGLKPYPRYKDSGLSWVPRIPEDWQVARNGRLFIQRNQTGYPELPILEVSINTGVRVRALNTSTTRKQFMADRAKYKRAVKGDISYNMMRMWQGAVGTVPVDGLVSPAYVVATPFPGTNSRFFAFLFRTDSYKGQINHASRGIVPDRNRLYWLDFKQLFSVVPPSEVQTSIVKFLDHMNVKFEKAINAKRRLMDLLNEQRQVIIRRAVTSGLDPFARHRPSSISWLGDIPADWEVRKIKHLVRSIGGMTPHKGTRRYWTGSMPWVSPKDMKGHEICDSQDHISSLALAETNIPIVRPPAVLIVVRGMILARTFPTAITRVPVTINQDMKALVPGNIDPEFLVFLLKGTEQELLMLIEMAGHGTRCLRTDSWENFQLPVPPRELQEKIISRLRSDVTSVDADIDNVTLEIGLIREYRTRLTTDVATGQLDVRDIARDLPSEIEDLPLEQVDEAEMEAETEEVA